MIHPFISRKIFGAASCGLALAVLAGCATPAAAPSVSLLEPANGATVGTTFKVVFGVAGMKVAPAGEIVANSGHNHLLINKASVPAGETIPFDDQHKHFGTGQTETMITLPPGRYTLTSQFANGAHHVISGSYVEFAERKVLPSFIHLPVNEITRQQRREGFEAGNADKIFESTYSSQTDKL